jgi:hypothetical protein
VDHESAAAGALTWRRDGSAGRRWVIRDRAPLKLSWRARVFACRPRDVARGAIESDDWTSLEGKPVVPMRVKRLWRGVQLGRACRSAGSSMTNNKYQLLGDRYAGGLMNENGGKTAENFVA